MLATPSTPSAPRPGSESPQVVAFLFESDLDFEKGFHVAAIKTCLFRGFERTLGRCFDNLFKVSIGEAKPSKLSMLRSRLSSLLYLPGVQTSFVPTKTTPPIKGVAEEVVSAGGGISRSESCSSDHQPDVDPPLAFLTLPHGPPPPPPESPALAVRTRSSLLQRMAQVLWQRDSRPPEEQVV